MGPACETPPRTLDCQVAEGIPFMLLSWLWSWRARLDRAAHERTPAPRPAHRANVVLETLEDRNLLSSTPVFSALHEAWRDLRFTVDDAAISAASQVSTAGVSSVNNSFGSMIGLDSAFNTYNYRGQGYSVVVIDTGIDYTHSDLGGAWGTRVVAGWDFVNNDADPMDDNGHGTHVAGIIGSSNVGYSGVAPNVNLIALKVLDSKGSGAFGAVEDALNWVIAHRAQYNIASINLSLGSGNYASTPFDFLEDEFQALTSTGVFVAVASGNSFYSKNSQPGIAFPGVSPNVVSVGAVWNGDFGNVGFASGSRDYTTAADRIASFTQRASTLDIMAPGALINSTYLNNGYKQMAGTSMATPVVAGAAALVRQALDAAGKSASQSDILNLMQSSGVAVVDGDDEDDNVTNTGLTFKRLDLFASLNAASKSVISNVPPTLTPITSQSLAPGGTLVVTLSASSANNLPIAYSARLVNAPAGGVNPLFQLKQTLTISYSGSYYFNTWSMNEKWLLGAANVWYAILPNGQLRKWSGDVQGTMTPANLVANLPIEVYDDPSLLWNAQEGAGGAAPVSLLVAGNQIRINAASTYTGTFQVEAAASDGKGTALQTFLVTVAKPTPPAPPPAPANLPPIWTPIPDQKMKAGQGILQVALNARDPEGLPVAYSARVVGSAANISVSVVGNQLSLTPPPGFSGKFAVEVSASDGKLASATTFQVEVAGLPPALGDMPNVTVPKSQRKVVFNVPILNATESVNLSVKLVSIENAAAKLQQQLGLVFAGSYYTNFMGQNEKWMVTRDFRTWYAILPNGEVRKAANTRADLLKPENLIATLSPSYYADPSLLWNAQAPKQPKGNLTLQGTQVVLELQEEFVGTLGLEVSVSDGVNVAKKVVLVTFA